MNRINKIFAAVTVCVLVISLLCMSSPVIVAAATPVKLKKNTARLVIIKKEGKEVCGKTKIKVQKSAGVKIKKVNYKVKNKKIASVTPKGVVTAKKKGQTQINVTVVYKKGKKTKSKKIIFKISVTEEEEKENTADTPSTQPSDESEDENTGLENSELVAIESEYNDAVVVQGREMGIADQLGRVYATYSDGTKKEIPFAAGGYDISMSDIDYNTPGEYTATLYPMIHNNIKKNITVTVAEKQTWEDFEYVTDGKIAYILSYTGNDSELYIPDTINGILVINACVRYEDGGIGFTSRRVPKGARYFSCEFENQLEEIIVSPDNLRYSSKDGVLFNKEQDVLIAYPSSKRTENYIIPDTVKTIEKFAFLNTGSFLKTITIPASVQMLDGKSIYSEWEETNLQEVNVDANNKNYKSEEGVLFSKDMKEILYYPKEKKDIKYVIPEGVESIYSNFMNTNPYVESVVIPDSVHTVGYPVFSTPNLKNVYLEMTEYRGGSHRYDQWGVRDFLESRDTDVVFYVRNKKNREAILEELAGYSYDFDVSISEKYDW